MKIGDNDVNKYIGIPYLFAGHSFDGADCIGLARLFYHEHHYLPELYDGEFEKDWWKKDKNRMVRWLVKNMTKVDIENVEYGDFMYFNINGEGHCGIYVGNGKMLSTFPPSTPQWDGSILPDESMLIPRRIWSKGIRACFRRKKG